MALTYWSRSLTSLLSKLSVTVRNIYIRYEDPGTCLGFTWRDRETSTEQRHRPRQRSWDKPVVFVESGIRFHTATHFKIIMAASTQHAHHDLRFSPFRVESWCGGMVRPPKPSPLAEDRTPGGVDKRPGGGGAPSWLAARDGAAGSPFAKVTLANIHKVGRAPPDRKKNGRLAGPDDIFKCIFSCRIGNVVCHGCFLVLYWYCLSFASVWFPMLFVMVALEFRIGMV